jgi:predicted protein tyrosine phosphatase
MILKLLFICWSAQNRSPTAALMYSHKYLTKALGYYDLEREELLKWLEWCDTCYVFGQEIYDLMKAKVGSIMRDIEILHVEDIYCFNEPLLIEKIKEEIDLINEDYGVDV